MNKLQQKIRAIHDAEAAYVDTLIESVHLMRPIIQEYIAAEYLAKAAGRSIPPALAKETRQDVAEFLETL